MVSFSRKKAVENPKIFANFGYPVSFLVISKKNYNI
jgi:hypothetical protein